MTDVSERADSLSHHVPEVLHNLWTEMREDGDNQYWSCLLRDDQGGYCLIAERVHAADHRMLFRCDPEKDDTLQVVQGLGWHRCALGLSRRPLEPRTCWRPKVVRKGKTRLVRFTSGLELYLVDVPHADRIRADVLLDDLISLEHYYYSGRHFVDCQPFDPTSDPYARLLPYMVHASGEGATWSTAAPAMVGHDDRKAQGGGHDE